MKILEEPHQDPQRSLRRSLKILKDLKKIFTRVTVVLINQWQTLYVKMVIKYILTNWLLNLISIFYFTIVHYKNNLPTGSWEPYFDILKLNLIMMPRGHRQRKMNKHTYWLFIALFFFSCFPPKAFLMSWILNINRSLLNLHIVNKQSGLF